MFALLDTLSCRLLDWRGVSAWAILRIHDFTSVYVEAAINDIISDLLPFVTIDLFLCLAIAVPFLQLGP